MFEINSRYNENLKNEARSGGNSGFNNKINFSVMRGDIFYVELKGTGSEQHGARPFLVTSNNACNKYSPVITGVPLTSQLHKKRLPTHCMIGTDCGLKTESIALVEAITSLSKTSLISKIGHCNDKEMTEIEKAIQVQNGISPKETDGTQIKQERRYYSSNEKFQNEVFDIYKTKKMAKTITELEKFICKYDNPEVNPVKDSVEILIAELKDYCDKFNKDYRLFYKAIINKIGNCGGAVVNG